MNTRVIIQIGAHIGNTTNDPIFSNVDNNSHLILVEPVPYLFEQLKQNYNERNDIGSVCFINKAVSNFIGEIELTIPSPQNDFSKFPYWASQLSSINKDHIKYHSYRLGDKIYCLGDILITEQIMVETTTIDEIIKDYDVSEIELLHIDTEGHDYEILMAFSFNIKPEKILYEHKHMTKPTCEILKKRLVSLGYKFKYNDSEDTMFELLSSETESG
tara:strand:+ start:736 stop:1383 length:648 start_codon:yes stop_codon:yes gene_type:complete